MATPAEQVDAIIAGAIAKADQYTTLVEASASELVAIADASRFTNIARHNIVPVVSAIEPDVPEVDDATFVYEVQYEKLLARLTDELANFFVEYYPIDNDAFDEGIAWLKTTIQNGGQGLSSAVEDQIWTRGKDRLVREGQRQIDQVVTGFAAKGYSFPPGLIAAKVREVNLESFQKLGELASTITIRQAELYLETLKFAVDLAVKTRLQAISAAADYIRALMSAPDAAARIAALNSDAKARMMAATADLYRARLTKDQILLNTHVAKAEGDIRAISSLVLDDTHKSIDEKIRASQAAATLYGDTARAALSSLSAIASNSIVSA